MKKYLAYYENEWPANIAELTAVENKPFVGYLKGLEVKYTVIPLVLLGNEIWYTTIDGNVVTPNDATVFGANIVRNTYENGKGVISFDGSVTSLGDEAFYWRQSLTSITIPDSVTSIGEEAFRDCSNLTSIVIPNSVTSIGEEAFYNCRSLTSVTIPNSVTSIGDGAFSYTSLTTPVYNAHCFAYLPTTFEGAYVIPEGIKQIAGYAFDDRKYLTSVTLPNSVESIGEGAFRGCSSLTSVTIPNSVTSIGVEAFKGCKSLTSPVYNAHCFAYLPTSFKGAYVIPEGIKQIAGTAFSSSYSLTSVTIPNSVTSIGGYAFSNCYGLTSITFESTKEEWNNITKGSYWNNGAPATYVQCTDGQVTL